MGSKHESTTPEVRQAGGAHVQRLHGGSKSFMRHFIISIQLIDRASISDQCDRGLLSLALFRETVSD
jgi:hypothetical protein